VIIEAEIGRVAHLEGLRARIDRVQRDRVRLLLWQEYLEFKVGQVPALFLDASRVPLYRPSMT
jgi:hypothetical protein